jgi:hypothetical protein
LGSKDEKFFTVGMRMGEKVTRKRFGDKDDILSSALEKFI